MLRQLKSFILAIAFCLPVMAGAQTRQPLTHDLLWSFQRVGAPVVSPDGRWVVFPVVEPAYDPAKEVNDLWIAATDGSAPPRRLTSAKGSESGPAWSPDSTRLAFSARRDEDETAQIYVLDVARGGEAHRITHAPTSAGAPRWSPDGTRIVFQASVWPGAADEEANRKAAAERRAAKSRVRIYETYPFRNFDRWLDESRTGLFLVRADASGADRTAVSLLAGSALAGLRGFGAGASNAVFAPDGQSIVFTATDHGDRAARENVSAFLWQVPVGGGEPVKLDATGWDAGAPRFSPDGRTLCFPASEAKAAIYTLGRLACASWPWKGDVREMARPLDRAIDSFAFSPDSTTIYFTAEDNGREKIYAVPAAGGAHALVMDAPAGVYANLQVPSLASAPMLYGTWESAVSPAEIVRVDPMAKSRVFLTSFNTKKAASIDWQPLLEFTSPGANGKPMHSYIALPPNFDPSKKYPLFVLIHGGHAGSWRDAISYRWNYHLLTHPGFVLLATDYRGSTGYGEQFTLDILGDPLKGPAEDINAAADEAIRRYAFIDGSRQAAGGASYGGHLVNWLAGTATRYKALVSHAGLASLDMQWATSDGMFHRELMMGRPFWENPERWLSQSPLARAGSFKTPILLSVGENDFRVPEGNTFAMYAAYQRMNAPARLLIWPDENHWILKGENSRVFYREVRAWLEKYLLN